MIIPAYRCSSCNVLSQIIRTEARIVVDVVFGIFSFFFVLMGKLF